MAGDVRDIQKAVPRPPRPRGRQLSADVVVEAWDRCAPEWARWVRSGRDADRECLLDPVMLRLLGDLRGSRILDVGCGEGYFSRVMARREADVVGLDISPAMIGLAQEEEGRRSLGITYCLGDMTDLSVFGKETFDAVTAYLSLSDCIDHQLALREAARVLKKKGRLVYCLPHPCFFTPGASWEPRDRLRVSGSDHDKLHWKVDRYFQRERVDWMVYPNLPGSTPHFHRPLQDYLEATWEAGLQVTALVEPVPSAQLLAESENWQKYLRIGFYLVVQADRTR